ITEVYDYLRLLFARAGEPRCPNHGQPLEAQTVSQMVDQVLALPEGTKIMLLAPVVRGRKGEHLHLFQQLRAQGFVRVRINGVTTELDTEASLEKNKNLTMEDVVGRFEGRADDQQRLAESLETCLQVADRIAVVTPMDAHEPNLKEELLVSSNFACP